MRATGFGSGLGFGNGSGMGVGGMGSGGLGLTMFGVTTPCVQAVTKLLADDFDCLVFHATGVGGRGVSGVPFGRLTSTRGSHRLM